MHSLMRIPRLQTIKFVECGSNILGRGFDRRLEVLDERLSLAQWLSLATRSAEPRRVAPHPHVSHL